MKIDSKEIEFETKRIGDINNYHNLYVALNVEDFDVLGWLQSENPLTEEMKLLCIDVMEINCESNIERLMRQSYTKSVQND